MSNMTCLLVPMTHHKHESWIVRGGRLLMAKHEPINQCDQSIEEVLNCLMPFAYYDILCTNVVPKTYYYPTIS
jgi:hypothetical protein